MYIHLGLFFSASGMAYNQETKQKIQKDSKDSKQCSNTTDR